MASKTVTPLPVPRLNTSQRLVLRSFDQVFDGKCMSMGNIAYMDEIADAASIAGIIIGAMNGHLRQFANGCLGNGGNEIGWFADWHFANQDAWMSANRIEITEKDTLKRCAVLENSLMICSPICLV